VASYPSTARAFLQKESAHVETSLNLEEQRRNFCMERAIAIQAFNKADSALRALDSIVQARGSKNYDLFILQDGCSGSSQTEKYRASCAETRQALQSWISRNRDHFASIRFEHSDQNSGPYQTAERLITWALESSKSVIFSEDDLIFERDAIEWFERALSHPIFLLANVWAIAGESKFFDSYRHVPSDADVCRALEVAQTRNLIDRFVRFDFLPSSCFATTGDKWAEFGKTRGTTNGDRAVVERCRAEAKLCFWPVVARCRDIGMHHPFGYSVRWKGVHHKGFKNSYIVSGMLKGMSEDLSELTFEKDALLTEFNVFWQQLES